MLITQWRLIHKALIIWLTNELQMTYWKYWWLYWWHSGDWWQRGNEVMTNWASIDSSLTRYWSIDDINNLLMALIAYWLRNDVWMIYLHAGVESMAYWCRINGLLISYWWCVDDLLMTYWWLTLRVYWCRIHDLFKITDDLLNKTFFSSHFLCCCLFILTLVHL